MAPSPLFLLLRLFSKPPKIYSIHRDYLASSSLIRHFSLSSSANQSNSHPPDAPGPSSLSARLSFVFEQINQIEKERSEKDDALQRIRAWRESKKLEQKEKSQAQDNNSERPGLDSSVSNSNGNVVDLNSGAAMEDSEEKAGLVKKEIELVHPWPEWIELMERLVQQNYFDHRRKDEDKMIEGLREFDMPDLVEEGFDFTRDFKTVQAAMLNFGRDRFDIFRSLSRQDIQVLVGFGCPNSDKKVVFSSKLLRKHVHLDEGDVCSSCSLRSSCERAYLVTNKEDEARSIDIMRVLLTYGFEPINGSVTNKSLLKRKALRTVIRKLLHEILKLSSVPIDPNLPPPIIKKREPKVKQPPPPPKKRVGRDDIEMKKGDWLCSKCDFMNFAKNTVCLQCDARRPKRQLLPGEWECPQCNFLNYRRNMTCFHCEHKRPHDEYMENLVQERQRGPPSPKLDRKINREEISNAWNFDFDDDESDGADVAAFEYADPAAIGEDRDAGMQAENMHVRGSEGDLYHAGRISRAQDAYMRPKIGFDDFDDEVFDVDNYEVEDQDQTRRKESSSLHLSDIESDSDSEGDGDFSGNRRTTFSSRDRSPRHLHQKQVPPGSDDDVLDFDSDEDLPVHPKWKSSHVAESGLRSRGSRVPSRRMRFVSDDDEDLSGSEDDSSVKFTPRYGMRGGGQSSSRRGGYADFDDKFTSKNVMRGGGQRNSRRGGYAEFDNKFTSKHDMRGGGQRSSRRGGYADFDDQFTSKHGMRDGGPRSSRRGGFSDFEDDSDVPRANGRGANANRNKRRGVSGADRQTNYFERSLSKRSSDSREFFDGESRGQRRNGRGRGGRSGQTFNGRGRQQSGSFNDFDNWSNTDNDRPRRERINVR